MATPGTHIPHTHLQLVLLLGVSLHHGRGGGLRLGVVLARTSPASSCRLLLSSSCLVLPSAWLAGCLSVLCLGPWGWSVSNRAIQKEIYGMNTQVWTACVVVPKDKFEQGQGHKCSTSPPHRKGEACPSGGSEGEIHLLAMPHAGSHTALCVWRGRPRRFGKDGHWHACLECAARAKVAPKPQA